MEVAVLGTDLQLKEVASSQFLESVLIVQEALASIFLSFSMGDLLSEDTVMILEVRDDSVTEGEIDTCDKSSVLCCGSASGI